MKKRNSLSTKLFIISFLIIPLIEFLLFYVYVNFKSISMAFTTMKNGKEVLSLLNFKTFFEELGNSKIGMQPRFVNTFIFFGVSLFISLPINFFVAYFIYKKIKFYKFFRIIFFLPAILPAVVNTTLYKNLLDVRGPIAEIWKFVFNLPKTPNFFGTAKYAKWAIVGYNVWYGFGTHLILLQGAMSRLPEEIFESAKLDGVGLFKELTSLIIPLVWPTLTTIILLMIVGIFTSTGSILLFTQGAYDTDTLAFWMFNQVLQQTGNQNYVSAAGLTLTLFTLPLALGSRYLMNKVNESIEY